MERAGADEVEVADLVALLHHVLDAPDQVAVAGVVLEHDRRTLRGRVIDQQLDLVAVVARILFLLVGVFFFLVEHGALDRAVEHVLFHRIQKPQHCGQVLMGLAHRTQQVRHRRAQHLVLGALDRFAHRLAPTGEFVEQILELVAPGGDAHLDRAALGLGQGLEGLGRQHLALRRALGREDKAFGRLQQRNALGGTGLAEFAQRAFFARLVRGLQGFDAVDVGVAVERGFERRTQLADKGLHMRAQRRPAPRRQGEQARLERLVEIVQVAQVGRHRLARRAFAQQAEGGGMLAGAGLAQHEHVVTGVAHRQAEVDRLDRAFLPQVAGVLGEVGGGVEAEAGRVAAPAQGGCRQRHKIGH